jgi:hypothetical protein
MQVEETQTFKQHDQNPEWTSCKTEARIVSKFGWGMTGRIEGFGQSSFIANAAKVSSKSCCIYLFMLKPVLFVRLVKGCNTFYKEYGKSNPTEYLSLHLLDYDQKPFPAENNSFPLVLYMTPSQKKKCS